MIGQVLGSYRVTAEIGKGGMGVVYLAEHTLIGRSAAIKVLLPEFSQNPSVVSRFFNEAKAATAIRDAGIVEIYDFGYHTDNSAYIVMEYLDGEPLQSRLQRMGRLSPGKALAILGQVTSALGAAHAKGIVHRDLKPDNVFLVPDSQVFGGERAKILDFGIAKLGGEASIGSYKTRTGAVMGTPAYMSPEQCKGAGDVDHRSDLYALGCILFEMLVGRPPFVAAGGGEVLAQQIYAAPPPLHSVAPGTSPQLHDLVARLLAKEPGDRVQTTAELSSMLHAIPEAGASRRAPSHAPPVSSPYAAGPSSPTTLSSAASAMHSTAADSGRKNRALAIAAAAVLVVGGGITAAAVLGGGGDDGSTAAAEADDEPEESEETPDEEPEEPEVPTADEESDEAAEETAEAPPEVADITVTITSDPKGAAVYRMPQAVRVGNTPYELTMKPTPGELEFVVKRNGYEDATVVVPADRASNESVVLAKKERRRTATRPRPRRNDPPPKKKDDSRKRLEEGAAVSPW